MPLLIIPLVLAMAIVLWYYSQTQNAFCTVILGIILSYFMLGIVMAAQGMSILPDIEPKLPDDVDMPEEFLGRPNLYIAFLLEQAAEQENLVNMIEARGPGSDPSNIYDRWNIL